MDEKYINEGEVKEYSGKIKPEFISKAKETYRKYKGELAPLHQRIIQNNKWYRAQYGRIINPDTNETEPATGFIFSAIENRYADAVDNFPIPNLLEREPSDNEVAKILSKIIPVQLEMSGFKAVYKDNWRRKLKHGTAIYGVFYNGNTKDIDIRAIDIMSIYCDIHVRDVQDSQFLFITNAVDNEVLKETYPDFKPLFHGDANIETYSGIYQLEDRTEIIDCYYKKVDGTLHMMKFAHGHVIDSTEDTEGYENGLYEHGLYPVIFDVLYPEEDSVFGIGIVDIVKNPQQYIDKLDGVIIKNAILSGKQRYLVRNDGMINEKELADMSKNIIHVEGSLDETHFKALQANYLPGLVREHRAGKIQELKEIIGNRDFQQGHTSNGVTAANAITALQQAGEKLSRAMIDDSYDVYKRLVIMCVEIMREFYDEERVFRITNETGGTEYTEFDNTMLINEKPVKDALGFTVDTEYKRAEFDIEVIPQRQNPFTKEGNNQTILNLWTQGFFNPQNFDVSLIALQSMNFDGKEKVIEQIQELQQRQQQMQQQQMMAQQQMQPPQGDFVEVGDVPQSEYVEVGDYGG